MPSWIANLVRLDGGGDTFRTSMALGAGPRLFGGLIAAQALAAAGATVGADLLSTQLFRPHGCCLDPQGRLVVADSDNDRIIVGDLPGGG
jgi:hypothetical protein